MKVMKQFDYSWAEMTIKAKVAKPEMTPTCARVKAMCGHSPGRLVKL